LPNRAIELLAINRDRISIGSPQGPLEVMCTNSDLPNRKIVLCEEE